MRGDLKGEERVLVRRERLTVERKVIVHVNCHRVDELLALRSVLRIPQQLRADTSWSSSSCEIHKRRGGMEWCLLQIASLIPLRLSILSRRAAYAGVLGSSRWTWSKSEWSLRMIIWRMFESLVWCWTSNICYKIVPLNTKNATLTCYVECLDSPTVLS